MSEYDVVQHLSAMRQDFPILNQTVNGQPLVYLDSANTAQAPRIVSETIAQYMNNDHANVHRGVHTLSVRATQQFEAVRQKVKRFLNAYHASECIFVRGTTEAINLVAHSYASINLTAGDEILITHMEHHANIVPWQRICQQTGAILKVVSIDVTGEIIWASFEEQLSSRTKIVAITHASNALGTINPIQEMVKLAHKVGAVVLVDGAQACPHMPVDVQALGCDFYAFSAHKLYGPTGVGVLWGRLDLLNSMIPYQSGGEMIRHVTFEATEYAPVPSKFEAGTPNISGVIGLGAALGYLDSLNTAWISAYENSLLAYATEALLSLKKYRIIGLAKHKVPVLSFVHESIHAHDIGTILDQEGIAIRSGHHCAMPLMNFYNVAATSRMSLAFYNTHADVDRCIAALKLVETVFGI